jgi:hypothetical protein
MIARIARGVWCHYRDAGLQEARDRLVGALRDLEGYRGLMVVEDSAAAAVILTTYWATATELSAAESTITGICDPILREVSVDHQLVAVSVGAAAATEGSWVRVLETSVDADKVSLAITHFRERVVPPLGQTTGFLGAVLFVDPAGARSVVATAWDTGEHMLLSATRLAAQREEARVEFGLRIRRVWNARLLLADLPAGVPAAP